MTPTPQVLRGLLAKYLEIKRLREEDAAGEAGDPKPAMAALAARYPGALRELDRRTMGDLEARVSALTEALAQRRAPVLWMRLWSDYHGFMRVALRLRQQRFRGVEAVWARLQTHYRPAPDEPSLGQLADAGIAELLHPPGGRLNAWVYAQVGKRHGLSPERVEALLFARLSSD